MKHLTLLLILTLSIHTHSQRKGHRGTYVFPDIDFSTINIPDSLSGTPSFYLSNVRTTDFMSSYTTETIVFERIYINSKAAAEKYSKRELFISNDGDMSMLAARTLKKNGEIITLEGDQIIETTSEEKNKYGTSVYRRIQFIYPNIEVGDVIDLAYQLDIPEYVLSDLLYLENEMPSLYSRITLRNFSFADLTVFNINHMPEMKMSNADGGKIISWEKKGVASLKTGYFNSLPTDLPCAIYALWRRGETLDYKTFYRSDAYSFPDKFDENYSISSFLVKQGAIIESGDSFSNLIKFLAFIENEYSWNYHKNSDDSKVTLSLFKGKKIDRTIFTRVLTQFLMEQNIKYEKCFTKSLIDGQFIHGLVSLEQMNNRFMIVYDSNENPHFIFPPQGSGDFFKIDEIPYYLEGNQSIVFYGENDFLKNERKMLIPESNQKNNTHQGRIIIKLNTNDSLQYSASRKDVFTGHNSFLTRNSNGNFWLKEFGVIQNDTLEVRPESIKNIYPYGVTFSQDTLVTQELFERIDDSLVWFQPAKILPQGIYQDDEIDSEFGVYLVLPFLKSTNLSFFIQSESSIFIAEENTSLSFSNEIGEIKIDAYQINQNTLKFTFSTEVKERYIQGQLVDQFQELIQKYLEFINKKWVLTTEEQ
ncbi:MAG: DUF3857 domain-containing protein [Fluviicola sp.]|nr:DUF3857 domain-containing protein [Fluviicola sp.]